MDTFCKLKIFFGRTATIDNYVFRLHYKVTFVILIALAILVALKPLINKPISCFSGRGLPVSNVDDFCWTHATFTHPEDWEKKVSVEVPFPGVGKGPFNRDKIYYNYYQWVFLALFFQGIAFYLPGYFWKRMEGGKIKGLIGGLNSPFLSEDKIIYKRNLIVEYMAINISNHNLYFLIYALAEILNFLNVVAQIFFMNDFLGGEFLSSVAEVTEITDWGRLERNDSLAKIFPRVTKCYFNVYGSSGDTQRHDAMCILTMNSFNEKIYIFLFIWFVILAVLSAMALLYRAITILYPKSRLMVTRVRVRAANQHCIEAILNKCQYGDWFILDLLSKNLDLLNFRSVIHDLAPRLDSKAAYSSNIFLNEIQNVDTV